MSLKQRARIIGILLIIQMTGLIVPFVMLHPVLPSIFLTQAAGAAAQIQIATFLLLANWWERRHGVSRETFYKWRRKYGGLKIDEAKRLRALEDENRRLKRVVADQALNIQVLKDLLGKP